MYKLSNSLVLILAATIFLCSCVQEVSNPRGSSVNNNEQTSTSNRDLWNDVPEAAEVGTPAANSIVVKELPESCDELYSGGNVLLFETTREKIIVVSTMAIYFFNKTDRTLVKKIKFQDIGLGRKITKLLKVDDSYAAIILNKAEIIHFSLENDEFTLIQKIAFASLNQVFLKTSSGSYIAHNLQVAYENGNLYIAYLFGKKSWMWSLGDVHPTKLYIYKINIDNKRIIRYQSSAEKTQYMTGIILRDELLELSITDVVTANTFKPGYAHILIESYNVKEHFFSKFNLQAHSVARLTSIDDDFGLDKKIAHLISEGVLYAGSHVYKTDKQMGQVDYLSMDQDQLEYIDDGNVGMFNSDDEGFVQLNKNSGENLSLYFSTNDLTSSFISTNTVSYIHDGQLVSRKRIEKKCETNSKPYASTYTSVHYNDYEDKIYYIYGCYQNGVGVKTYLGKI